MLCEMQGVFYFERLDIGIKGVTRAAVLPLSFCMRLYRLVLVSPCMSSLRKYLMYFINEPVSRLFGCTYLT